MSEIERLFREDVEDMIHNYLVERRNREDREMLLRNLGEEILNIADKLYNDDEYIMEYLKGAV